MRRIVGAALIVLTPSILLTAQSPAPPAFEVASVKRSPTQSRGAPRRLDEITLQGVRVLPGGRIESYGHTLRNLIAWAYEVNTLFRKIEGTDDGQRLRHRSRRAAHRELTAPGYTA